jgi:hypothetical protein
MAAPAPGTAGQAWHYKAAAAAAAAEGDAHLAAMAADWTSQQCAFADTDMTAADAAAGGGQGSLGWASGGDVYDRAAAAAVPYQTSADAAADLAAAWSGTLPAQQQQQQWGNLQPCWSAPLQGFERHQQQQQQQSSVSQKLGLMQLQSLSNSDGPALNTLQQQQQQQVSNALGVVQVQSLSRADPRDATAAAAAADLAAWQGSAMLPSPRSSPAAAAGAGGAGWDDTRGGQDQVKRSRRSISPAQEAPPGVDPIDWALQQFIDLDELQDLGGAQDQAQSPNGQQQQQQQVPTDSPDSFPLQDMLREEQISGQQGASVRPAGHATPAHIAAAIAAAPQRNNAATAPAAVAGGTSGIPCSGNTNTTAATAARRSAGPAAAAAAAGTSGTPYGPRGADPALVVAPPGCLPGETGGPDRLSALALMTTRVAAWRQKLALLSKQVAGDHPALDLSAWDGSMRAQQQQQQQCEPMSAPWSLMPQSEPGGAATNRGRSANAGASASSAAAAGPSDQALCDAYHALQLVRQEISARGLLLPGMLRSPSAATAGGGAASSIAAASGGNGFGGVIPPPPAAAVAAAGGGNGFGQPIAAAAAAEAAAGSGNGCGQPAAAAVNVCAGHAMWPMGHPMDVKRKLVAFECTVKAMNGLFGGIRQLHGTMTDDAEAAELGQMMEAQVDVIQHLVGWMSQHLRQLGWILAPPVPQQLQQAADPAGGWVPPNFMVQ